MEIQAWIVTIPIGKWNQAGCKNLRNRYPALVKKIGEEGFMDMEILKLLNILLIFAEK